MEKPSPTIPEAKATVGGATPARSDFAMKLRALKKARGWTNAQVAAALGTSKSRISKWINGEANPRNREDMEMMIERAMSVAVQKQTPPPDEPPRYTGIKDESAPDPGTDAEPQLEEIGVKKARPVGASRMRPLEAADRKWDL